MTKISNMVPAILLIISFISVTILFYSSQAVSEHNEKDEAHPNLILSIQANTAQIGLLAREAELRQVRTDENFARSDKAQERILDALIRIEQKVAGQ